jgi:hypothetical protein
MFLRSDAATYLASARSMPALRLPFSRDPKRAPGKDYQTPRLFEKPGNGRGQEGTKLDDLFAANTPHGRIGAEFNVFAGLHSERSSFQTGLKQPGHTSKKVLRTAQSV